MIREVQKSNRAIFLGKILIFVKEPKKTQK